jgi:hypothetical protein
MAAKPDPGRMAAKSDPGRMAAKRDAKTFMNHPF